VATVLTATGVLAAVVLSYVGSCAVRPFRDCWRCDGTGHHRSAGNRKLSRPCRWCGKRMRLGRRAWNRARRIHHDVTG
jgi:hypothetical protein